MTYIPDALDMWKAHDRKLQEAVENLPKCTECGEPIQASDAVYINEGFICDSCLQELRREVLPEW